MRVAERVNSLSKRVYAFVDVREEAHSHGGGLIGGVNDSIHGARVFKGSARFALQNDSKVKCLALCGANILDTTEMFVCCGVLDDVTLR